MKPEVKQLIKTQAISTAQLNFDWPKTYMFILGVEQKSGGLR